MNKETLKFIAENWQLILKPSAAEFTALIERSPLQSVMILMDELRAEPLTLQALSDRARLHPNSVASITRALEGKLFASIGVGQQRLISLLPGFDLSVLALDQGSESTPLFSMSSPKSLIFKAELPPKKCFFKPIQSAEGKQYWEDAGTKAVRIYCKESDPWSKALWAIRLGIQNQKSDKTTWPYQVRLMLFPLADNPTAVPCQIERENIKGIFASAPYPTLAFYAFPAEGQSDWILYSFLPK
jgi:hypothetical protein